MRKAVIVTLVILFAIASTILAANLGPASATINAAAKKQPGVVFPHAKHVTMGKSCDTCHHTDKGLKEASAKVKKCSACHLDPKDKAPSMRDMSLTKNPFHQLCVNCHKTGKKGPTKCAECHKK